MPTAESEKSVYENGDAEAALLKALVPIAIVVALVPVVFRLTGMPGLDGEFAQLMRPIVNVLSIAGPAAAFLTWVVSRAARPVLRVNRAWAATQFIAGGLVFSLVLAALSLVAG